MKYYLIITLLFLVHFVQAQTEDEWVLSVYDAMSEDERIGQLMMIRAHSDKGPEHIAKVEKLIKEYHVGGLCFFQGTPEKQVELINKYQQMNTRIPMMVAMDAEWGLGMRFKKDGFSYPRQLMLGAIQDNRLIYDMGVDVARQLRRVGTHINFAPVVDINNNPNNPVINTRSFGEDRYNVATKSYMYMRGMQDANVMACAKHFPGHGDTDVDSHYDLPVITHKMPRLDSIELYPFRVLAQHGIQSMMIAHLHVPEIDDTHNLPTTLSPNAVNKLLKNEIGYEGLIFTDGLGMKGISKHHEDGEVEAKALVAGNDVLLLPQDVSAAFATIKKYIAEGKLTKRQIEYSVKKILISKYRLGLTKFEEIPTANLRKELESAKATILRQKLIESSLTMVRNKETIIPFHKMKDLSLASLSIGADSKTNFQKTLDKYAAIKHYQVKKEISSSKQKELLNALSKKKTVIVSLHDVSTSAKKDFGFTSSMKAFINELNTKTKVVLVVFGTPYSLKHFDDIDHLLCAYTEGIGTQEVAAQGLFGVFGMRGRLPVTASPKSKFNDGVNTIGLLRMGYGSPVNVGINAEKLTVIDSLFEDAIATKSTPGGVVLVSKNGKVVFEKAYGHHTYEKKKSVKVTDVYDLASITKIAAATLAVMKLHEEGKIDVNQPLSNYLTPLKGTNKADITLKEMMTHRAGLTTWIKFYEATLTSLKNPYPSKKFYTKNPTDAFSIPVTENLYLKTGYDQTMRNEIYNSDLRATKDYKYSDLGFYMIADMVKEQTGMSLDQYVRKHFYEPLGLQTMTFNPLRKISTSQIPPTEEDKYFRRQKVHGYVHDMGSAMLGGVSGHAGLFSNANDLAILMQMLLNGGYYGGVEYLNPQTIYTFTTRCDNCTRRGIGFDMFQKDTNYDPNFSSEASLNTFGHLGFTGTCVWADPDHGLIYILLTNRTYPSMRNYKFNKGDYRPKIQAAIYEALK